MDPQHPQTPSSTTTTPQGDHPPAGNAPLQHHHPVDQRTELEKFVSRSVNEMQQNWDGYGSKVVLYLSLGLLLVAAIVYWTRTKDNYQLAAWTQLNTAGSPVDLESIAEEFKDLPAGQWAALQAAEMHLAQATQLMFQDRKSAETELKSAREGYESILSGSNFPAEIRQRAQYGLAKTLETSSNGDLAPAIKAYEEAIAMNKESVTAELSQARIEELKLPAAKEFYAWFSQQNPEPEDLKTPDDKPQTGSTVPSIPDMGSNLSSPLGSSTLSSPMGSMTVSEPETSTSVPALTAPITPDPAFENKPEEGKPAEPPANTEAPMKEEAKAETPAPAETPSTTPESKPEAEKTDTPAPTETPAESAPAGNPQ